MAIADGADRVQLLGIDFDRLTYRQAIERIGRALEREEGGWVVTPNVDIMRQAIASRDCRDLVEQATLVLADGMPLIWASRLAGDPLPERVAGSDLVWGMPAAAAERGLPVFLLGGDPGVAERAAEILTARTPGLAIAGTLCPAPGFDRDPAAVAAVVREVQAAAPRVVLVALGFPKQEMVIRELRRALPASWMVGLGISLSYVTGDVKRAPRAVRRAGLEWMHRLVQEPQRLARRYLVYGLPFAARLLTHALWTRLQRGSRRREPPAARR